MGAAVLRQGMVRAGGISKAAGTRVVRSGPDTKPADNQGAARAASVHGVQQGATGYDDGAVLPMIGSFCKRESVCADYRYCYLKSAHASLMLPFRSGAEKGSNCRA